MVLPNSDATIIRLNAGLRNLDIMLEMNWCLLRLKRRLFRRSMYRDPRSKAAQDADIPSV